MPLPHWMVIALFVLLVLTLLIVLLVTFGYSIEGKRFQQRAGWVAGLVLAVLMIAASKDRFIALPEYDLDQFFAPLIYGTVAVQWGTVLLASLVVPAILKFLEQVNLPPRGEAALLLVVSFGSTVSLVHIFLIQTRNALVFSCFFGAVVGWFLHRAFLKDYSVKAEPAA